MIIDNQFTLIPNKFVLAKEQMLQAFYDMLLIRRFEERCGQLYGMGLIGGFCHLYIGQEAIVTATKLAKQTDDSVITSYRDHGHAILFGIEPRYVLAELLGKATGCSRGKGGSMHMFNIPGRFYGGHGIVGAQISLGTGLAFAAKYRATQNISYTFLGDGAANQGQMFESFNMAALWELPVVYIIENNEYAMGTSVTRSTKMTKLCNRGEGLGIQGIQANGMDLEHMYDVLAQASEFTRTYNCPLIIEAKTYRYRGHSMSDPAKYRTKEEVELYKNTDPINVIRTKLLEQHGVNLTIIQDIENTVKATVADAVEFAQNSPIPDQSELLTDVYI